MRGDQQTRPLSEARAILMAQDPGVLLQISAPGIAATVWQRPPLPAFSRWIGAVPEAQLPRLMALATPASVEPCIHAACNLSGLAAGPMRDMLASDIAALAFIMAEVMAVPLLRLRLQPVAGDGEGKWAGGRAPQFHIDQVSAQMLCTYRGPGTEMAVAGQEHAPVVLATGAAAILRGALWPGCEATSLLHRAPPAGQGATNAVRLLMVIEPVSDPAQSAAHSRGAN